MTGTEGAAGRLRDRVEVLEFKSAGADTPGSRDESVSSAGAALPQAWEWETVRRTWTQADLMTRLNVYSVHGQVQPPQGPDGGNKAVLAPPAQGAVQREGLAAQDEAHPRRADAVDAALVVLSRCRNPATGERFPAVMTERYAGHRQEEPMALNTHRRVLVAPKAVRLAPGPLVEVDGVEWPILTHYELDPHKNEYTLERTVDL